MSSIDLCVKEKDDTSELSESPKRNLTIKFVYSSGHFRWAKVQFKQFEGHFWKSEIKSVPCCDEAKVDEFDASIDLTHTRWFGAGHWIKKRRDQLGHGFTGPCANHEHAALVALDATRLRKRHREDEHTGGSFEGQLSALESRIRDLPSYVLSKQSDEPNKRPRNRKTNSTNGDRRQYWNTQAAIEEEASRIEQTLDDLVGSAPEDKKDDVVMIKSLCSSAFATARFVNIVKDRVAALRDKADAQVEVPMPLAQMFGYLRQWKTTGPTGFHNVLEGSARLVEALGSVRQGLARESAGLKSEYNLLEKCTGVFRLFLLDSMEGSHGSRLSTPMALCLDKVLRLSLLQQQKIDMSKKDRKNKKRTGLRHERSYIMLNKVINNLSKSIGPSALGIYAAIEDSKLTLLRDFRVQDMDSFAESAAKALEECVSERLPGNIQVLHIPSVLSWLLGVDYDLVCEGLHLPELIKNNPNITSRLDSLGDELSTLPRTPENEIRRHCLDQEARNTMRVPLSELRCKETRAQVSNHLVDDSSSIIGTYTRLHQALQQPDPDQRNPKQQDPEQQDPDQQTPKQPDPEQQDPEQQNQEQQNPEQPDPEQQNPEQPNPEQQEVEQQEADRQEPEHREQPELSSPVCGHFDMMNANMSQSELDNEMNFFYDPGLVEGCWTNMLRPDIL